MQDPLNASYPVLPLRDIVVFPHMIVPLFVGREKSVRALEEVMQDDKQILLSSQIDPADDDPSSEGIYNAGVLANVLQLLKLPDGTVKVLVEGVARVRICRISGKPGLFRGAGGISAWRCRATPRRSRRSLRTVTRRVRALCQGQEEHPRRGAEPPCRKPTEPAKLADLVAGHLGIEVDQKQDLLETLSRQRAAGEGLWPDAGRDERLQVEKKIKTRVKSQMERTQREYYLNEQMKAIQKELGDGEEGEGEMAELEAEDRRDQAEQGGARKGRGRAEEAQEHVAR